MPLNQSILKRTMITTKWLAANDACSPGYWAFVNVFGTRCDVNARNIRKAARAGLDLYWVAEKTFKKKAWKQVEAQFDEIHDRLGDRYIRLNNWRAARSFEIRLAYDHAMDSVRVKLTGAARDGALISLSEDRRLALVRVEEEGRRRTALLLRSCANAQARLLVSLVDPPAPKSAKPSPRKKAS